MAIKIEFVNLIIPIDKIRESTYPGGLEALINLHKNNIGKSVWFDEFLFRIGWMDTWMIDSEIDMWKEFGLTPIEKRNGVEYWTDLFAISTGLNQFMTNCEWIDIDLKTKIVWMKGTNSFDIYPNSHYLSHNIRSSIS